MKTSILSRRLSAAVAAIALCIAADDASANGGSGSHDHSDHFQTSGMKSRDSNRSTRVKSNDGDKHVERHKNKDKDEVSERNNKDREKHAEKSKHKDKSSGDKAPGDKTSKMTTSGKTTSATEPLPGSAANNTIHPIINNKPAQPTASAPTGTGKLPPNDPVGNTHPTPGANPPTAVTVSNGVSTTQIQNGLGGVYVYSDKPGTITVSNGKESTTLPGASVTLSGNVVGVGGGQGVEVGPRNGEGKTVVAIKPSAGPTPAAPTAGGNHTTGPGSITVTTDDLKTAGKVVGAVVAAPVVVDTYLGGTGLSPLGAVAAEGAAQVGATAVLPIAGAIAGYGLAKGGVSGAGDALKDSAGAVKDVTKDAAGAVKDAASAIIHLF